MLFRFSVNLFCVGVGKDAGILSSGRLLRWMLFVFIFYFIFIQDILYFKVDLMSC